MFCNLDGKKLSLLQAELHAFQKLSNESKKNVSTKGLEAEVLKPLPDILDFTLKQNDANTAAASTAVGNDEPLLPEVPPNSVEPVERSISVYDDDFLSAETEDIELF